MIILEIAGGIILAVLFISFLDEILVLSAGLIGIGLLIGVGVFAYFLFDTYFDGNPSAFIVTVVIIAFYIINQKLKPWDNEDNNNIVVVNTFHIPAYTVKKEHIMSSLLKIDGITSVSSNNDFREIDVNFNANKTSRVAIDKIISQLLDED